MPRAVIEVTNLFFRLNCRVDIGSFLQFLSDYILNSIEVFAMLLHSHTHN